MQRHKPPHNQADGQPEERSRDEMKENAEQRKTFILRDALRSQWVGDNNRMS